MSENIYTKLGIGSNLLFLHGWGQDRHTWDGVVEHLKNEFACWTPDLPGFGTNPRPNETWNPHNYAEWVAQFVADNKIDTPTIIGHSFGGRVAIELAALHTTYNIQNTKYIFYAAPGFREPISRFTSMAQALARGLKHARVPLDKIPGMSQIKTRLQSADDRDAEAMRDVFRATIEYDLATTMSKIEAPVLLVWGEHDREVPLVIARAMKEAIATSTLKIIPGGSHFVHLENPTLFCGMIRNFATQHV